VTAPAAGRRVPPESPPPRDGPSSPGTSADTPNAVVDNEGRQRVPARAALAGATRPQRSPSAKT